MTDYEHLYYMLFHAVTSALREMEQENTDAAAAILMQGQIDCEEEYISQGGEEQSFS